MNRLQLCSKTLAVLGWAGWLAFAASARVPIATQPEDPFEGGPTIAVPVPATGPGQPAADNRPGADAHTLRFFNGDTLHGVLLGAHPETGLRWSRSDARGVIEFGLSNVAAARLVERGVADRPHQRAIIRLTNDDELRGTIVSLDADNLVIDTWYAGPVTIKRTMTRSLQPNAAVSGTLYEGPTAADEWRGAETERGWVFRDNALYSSSSGSTSREVQLPDRARIDFDLAWRQYPYFQLAFYTDNLTSLYGNCYVLQVSGNSVYLQRASRNNMNNVGGGTNVDNLRQRARGRFSLLVDKPKKTIAVLLDGQLIKQWADPGDFAGKGTALLFQSQGQGMLRVSNILVEEWNGELGADEVVTAGKEDIIRFINNDKVSGRLKSIADNKIVFETPFASLDIPLERAAQIQLASDKAERARRQSADVRALFQDGGVVTLALEKLDEQTVVGQSENFGQRTFSRDAFRELRFNIYDERTAAGSSDNDWTFE